MSPGRARQRGSRPAAIDSLGSRLATKTSGGTFGWLIPDLHGDIAAAMTSAGSAISDAFRYDPYGKLVASATSALPTPWRYQGRLLESSGTDPALYDFGFRSYDPGLGTFTSLDDVAGQALNPATFNRFLYAEGNPETLTDPTGHCVTTFDGALECDQILQAFAAVGTAVTGVITAANLEITIPAAAFIGVSALVLSHLPTSTVLDKSCWRITCPVFGPPLTNLKGPNQWDKGPRLRVESVFVLAGIIEAMTAHLSSQNPDPNGKRGGQPGIWAKRVISVALVVAILTGLVTNNEAGQPPDNRPPKRPPTPPPPDHARRVTAV